MIHMEYYLVVSNIMMFAGIYGFFTRRNTLAILISCFYLGIVKAMPELLNEGVLYIEKI